MKSKRENKRIEKEKERTLEREETPKKKFACVTKNVKVKDDQKKRENNVLPAKEREKRMTRKRKTIHRNVFGRKANQIPQKKKRKNCPGRN